MIAGLIGVTVKNVNNTSDSIPDGFQSASFSNLGSANATLTQNGEIFVVVGGSTFNLPIRNDNRSWYGVTIDASGTEIQCVYY